MPPKIVHVETGTHLYGGALQVVYLLEGLRNAGVENVLVCPRGSAIANAARDLASDVHEVTMGGDGDIGFVSRLRRILRQHQPDLVHLHSRRGADLWGGVAARLAGIPVVLTRRVDNPEPHWWVALKYRLYDRVVTISQGIRRVLLEEGLPAAKVDCVPSAVDTSRFQPGCESDWFEAEFPLTKGQAVVGVVAQLIRRKGHRYLIEAITQIVQQAPHTRFVFFGRGPLESELKALCDNKGVAGYVHFAGFRNDIERVLPCIDVLVHPADMEGLGVTLLQAAACEVPIVATPVGGIPEIVRDGVNGYLVTPGDVTVLTKRIIALLSDAPLRHSLGQAGRALAVEHYSIEAMVRGNLEVYARVLGVQ